MTWPSFTTCLVLVPFVIAPISVVPFLFIPAFWHAQAVLLLTLFVGGPTLFLTGRRCGKFLTADESNHPGDTLLVKVTLATLLFLGLVFWLMMVKAGIEFGAVMANRLAGIRATNLHIASGLPGNVTPTWLLVLRGLMPSIYIAGGMTEWRRGNRHRVAWNSKEFIRSPTFWWNAIRVLAVPIGYLGGAFLASELPAMFKVPIRSRYDPTRTI